MNTVLVTGGNGFIGQHLIRTLIDKKVRVKSLIHEDLPLHFYRPEEVEFCKADISRPEQLAGVCTDIDTVFHLAAIPRNDLTKSREDYIRINVTGTGNLLDEARKSNVKRFIFISTVEAAGFGDGIHPRKESDTPAPVNNYGWSKLEAEKLVLPAPDGMECVVIRLPMIYGPGTLLIVPKLFGMVKKGVYPLIGSGTAKMEFCFVKNAVDAIILAGEKPGAAGELFYVSDERSYTIKEVVRSVADSMGRTVRFVHIPQALALFIGLCWELLAKIVPFPPVVSRFSRKPFFSRETVYWTTRDVNIVSTEKIRTVLGYKPRVTIQDGCRTTAEWLNAS